MKVCREMSNNDAFMKSFDELADKLGLTRPKLLKHMGVRSRSLASHWAAGNKPAEQHAFELALVEKRAFDWTDEQAAKSAGEWLKRSGRFDPNRHGAASELLALLKEQEASRAGEPYPQWISGLISELSLKEGKEWGEWVRACVHAQAAAQLAQDEWLESATKRREVWHLHFWNPSLSGTAFDAVAMYEQYEKLTDRASTTVNLMVLYDTASGDPTEPFDHTRSTSYMSIEEQKEREKFSAFLDAVQLKQNFRTYSRAHGKDVINTGDVMAFESIPISFALLIRVPARLPSVLAPYIERSLEAREKLVEIAAIPIRIRPEDYRSLLFAHGIEPVPWSDFGLRIISQGETPLWKEREKPARAQGSVK
jgi:hypothetical protein